MEFKATASPGLDDARHLAGLRDRYPDNCPHAGDAGVAWQLPCRTARRPAWARADSRRLDASAEAREGEVGQAAVNRSRREDELRREVELLRAENARLRALLGQAADEAPATRPAVSDEPLARTTLFEDDLAGPPRVDARSPADEKIALFRALFAGREDIHAVRWENARTGKSGWSPAVTRGARTASTSP
jgi:hypothetical protein